MINFLEIPFRDYTKYIGKLVKVRDVDDPAIFYIGILAGFHLSSGRGVAEVVIQDAKHKLSKQDFDFSTYTFEVLN